MWISGDLDYSPTRCERLRQLRREAVAGREACTYYKEGARMFQRQEKACTILLRYIEGDAGWEPPSKWPTELRPEIDLMAAIYALEP